MKFIYVFSEEDRDELLSQGFSLLQEITNKDKNKKAYVFENGEAENFSLAIQHGVLSNTLVL